MAAYSCQPGIAQLLLPREPPWQWQQRGHQLLQLQQQPDIHGTLLRKGDKAMLLPRCGEAHDTAHVISTFNENASTFEFPALSMESGFRARTYHLCWCQVNGNCTSAEHFRAFFGQVRLICPDKQADYNNDGTCSLCPSMLQRPGGMDGMECQMHLSSLLVALSWTLITTLFVFALCASVSLGFRGGSPSLHGKLRRIEDISKERGKLTITTAGLHNLATFGKWPIPVTLWQTGHYLLDSKPSRRLQLYVLISSDQSLEIVDKRGDPASFRADSSMGVLQISFARAMLNSCLPKTKFPLLAQLVLLAAASISLAILLNPQSWEMLLVLGSSICISVLLISIWKLTLRSSTRMDQRLKTYARVLQERNPSPQACPKGPGRAILVWDLLDMFEHFQAQIQDRNMYYIDPNIIRPLTAAKQLSYAELVGPRKVQWFVSHWWGTSFSVYCDALKRHAKAVNEDDEDAWKMTAYWICTFSNNQYQIAEELGKSHEESSFYLALHSGVCRGTCMILDEMAMPLKRSWCLFELLQTVHLEKSQMGFTGLLFCTSNGVLNFGSSTVEMSMRIGERLLDLSLRDAEATTEQDKQMITDLVLQLGLCRNATGATVFWNLKGQNSAGALVSQHMAAYRTWAMDTLKNFHEAMAPCRSRRVPHRSEQIRAVAVPCRILGVDPKASQEEIKKAYKREAMKWHPDKQPEEKRAEAQKRFSQVANAYETLSSADKRRMHDLGGGGMPGQAPGASGGFGGQGQYSQASAEDLFRQVFGGAGFDELMMNLHKLQGMQDNVRNFANFITAGSKVKVHGSKNWVLAACRRAGIDATNDRLRTQALGKKGSVIKVDPKDNTAKIQVDGVGDVWLPAEALQSDAGQHPDPMDVMRGFRTTPFQSFHGGQRSGEQRITSQQLVHKPDGRTVMQVFSKIIGPDGSVREEVQEFEIR
ncbi:unnamed protein product [Effrenium voratum]|uniref:J domain-containing protein n=1 Tax=Effrenium voratum TaxID=2562239 RepID=A0AA36I1H7_9DINO|nr:unnamed protein product [Effrenium voratum]